MESKKLINLPLSTELVVASRYLGGQTPHKDSKTVDRIREYSANIGTLVSYDTYSESYYRSSTPSHSDWTKTTSDRTKRFMVKFQDSQGSDVYAIIPAQDIICTKADVVVRWAEERAEREAKLAEEQRQQEATRAIEERRKATEDNVKQAVHTNLVELFGINYKDRGVRDGYIRTYSDAKLLPDGTYVGVLRNSGDIEIPVDLFLHMVHRFSEQ